MRGPARPTLSGRVLRLGAWLAISAASLHAGSSSSPTPDEIIQRFSARESQFQSVWQQYTYTQLIRYQILSRSGQPVEQREIVYEVYFTTEGERQTRKVSDRGGLSSLIITPEDLYDATNMQPFVLTAEEIKNYDIRYLGQERVDELDTFLFEVKPKRIERGKRYFKGKVWVDTEDLQIVMTNGKIEPNLGGNHFPRFETVREQIDGEYWFPTWTLADDTIHSRHLRVLMTYTDFQRYEVGTSIKFGAPVEAPPD